MKDRVCLITGGTSGVGRAIAIGIAHLGATVIIVSRSTQRGKSAVAEIRKKTGNQNIYYHRLDLGEIDSIPGFVARFKKEYNALHVLSNNAAVLPFRKEYTSRGIEKIFAINYLSHFVLTYLSLDLLKSSSPSRILTVSGSPSLLKFGKIDLNDINLDHGFNPLRATYRAAVAKVAFSHSLSTRLHGSQVSSNTFHPGLVKSDLAQQLPWILRIPMVAARHFFSEDCETGVYLASSPEVEGVTGQFFNKRKKVSYRPVCPVDTYASALWEKSKVLAGLS